MLVNKHNLAAYVFAFGYVFIFLNPMGIRNEVYPYFLISFFFLNKIRPQYLIATLVIASEGIVGQALNYSNRYLTDSLILCSVFLGYAILLSFSTKQISIVTKVFQYLLTTIAVICITEKIYPPLQDTLGSLFSGRGTNSEFLIKRNGAVAGIAPEPSYSAIHAISMYLFLLRNHQVSYLAILSIVIIVLLNKSIYGVFFLVLIVTLFPIKKYVYVLALLVVVVFPFSDALSDNFLRIISAVQKLIELRSISLLEASYGSERFTNVINSFQLPRTEYVTGFSILALAYQHYGLLLLPVLGIWKGYFAGMQNIQLIKCLILAALTGPSMLFLTYFEPLRSRFLKSKGTD